MKPLLQSNNKKGSIQDVFLIAIMLFIFAVFFVFVFIIQSKIDTAMSPAFENVSVGSSIGITTISTVFSTGLNFMYLSIFFALLIGTLIMAYMTPTNPIFYLLAIILFIGLMIVSVVLSNTWQTIAGANTDTVDAVSHLSFANYLLNNLPIVMLVVGLLIAIVLFARNNSSPGGTMYQQ